MTQRNYLIALGGFTALLLVLLPMTWWTASSQNSFGAIDASGWAALTIGRLLLLALIGVSGVLVVVTLRGPMLYPLMLRDGAHVVFGLAALATVLMLFRVVVAPNFAHVTSSELGGGLLGLSPKEDEAATSAIHYDRSGVVLFALLVCGAMTWLSVQIARVQPGGFQPVHLLKLVRDGQALARALRGRTPTASTTDPEPQPLPPDETAPGDPTAPVDPPAGRSSEHESRTEERG